ncbi:MAG: hypothetical protein F4W90_03855 [Gammaproteobacteria bacterium]|nr:hypothetical protein [Gammaproteobacteria bacterium]
MGRFLETLDFPPAIFLASDARRTQTTAHVLSAFVAGKVSTFRAMYTFGVNSLWQAVGDVILSGILDTEHSVAVVGHNSAVSDLGVELACHHDAGSLPTLGMVELTFAGNWDALLKGERVSLAQRLEPQA